MSSAPRRRIRRALLVALVVLGAAACRDPNATVDVVAPRPAAPLVAARCPTDLAGTGLRNESSPPDVPSGAVPDGFVPVSAVLCRLVDVPTADPDRVDSAITTNEGPVGADVLAALRLPDQAFTHPDRGACTADAVLLPYLLLLDQQRRAVRPAIPVDPCAKLRPEVARALATLALSETTRHVLDRG